MVRDGSSPRRIFPPPAWRAPLLRIRIYHGPRRIIAETDLSASASPENKNISWSETDHRRDGSFRLQPENKNISWSRIRIYRDGSSPRRIFPPPAWRAPLLRIRISHGPRRIIAETDLSASSLASASPENKNISWSETDHRRDGSFRLQPGERLS